MFAYMLQITGKKGALMQTAVTVCWLVWLLLR